MVTKLLCFCTIQVIKIAPVPYGVNQHKSKWGLDNLTAQDLVLPCSESAISVGIVGLSKNPSHALPMGRTGGVC